MSSIFDVADVDFDLLGAKNDLRAVLEDYVSGLAEKGIGFTVGNSVDKRQFDLLKIKGESGSALGEKFKEFYPYAGTRLAASKYFLRSFMCYVEVPTYRVERETGVKRASFDKFLATSSIEVANEWLGGVFEETAEKYGKSIIMFDDIESDDYEVPILKLGSNKMGNTLTRPRSYLNLDKKGIRVVPVFALKSYVDTLNSRIKNDVARVTFIKDNGTERVLDTCLSQDLLVSLYKDSSFVSGMLSSSYDGDFLGSSVISRGYIRVPEVGSSVYDGSGVSAISYTRIISIEYGVEPDMEFARVDLDGVVFSFSVYLSKLSDSEISQLVSAMIVDGFDLSSMFLEDGKPKFLIDSFQLESWADLMNKTLSTLFQRSLHLFMVTNPRWFRGYTGERKGLTKDVESTSLSSNTLLDDLDDLI